MASSIDVRTPEGSRYPILIERGLLTSIGSRASAFGLDKRTAIITNTTLQPLYGTALCSRLPNATLIDMPDGEQYKTLATVEALYGSLIDAGLDRNSTILALGGGVVGDTAGFAAATYMRGIRLVQVPTSLLAMVDSSVGGKVGVDLRQGKNLVGAFKQPALVLIDPDVLATLSPRERRCGMAEIIKHGLIADPGLLEMVSSGADDTELVRRAVQVKVDIVQADPYEHSVRAHLNLGHTFAHAIERVSHYAWPHGEAVGIGLVAAARLSQRLKLCDALLVERVEAAVRTAGLPMRLGELEAEALWQAMATDKKWLEGQTRFVLLTGLGQPQIVTGVGRDDVVAVLNMLK